jgi:hypothetical protein
MQKLGPQLLHDRVEFIRPIHDISIHNEIVDPLDVVRGELSVFVVFRDQRHRQRTRGTKSGSGLEAGTQLDDGPSGRVLMDLSELHVHRVTMVAPMALAGRKQRRRLFRTCRVNAPLFGPRHDHRGMKCLNLFACLGCHVGFVSRESS